MNVLASYSFTPCPKLPSGEELQNGHATDDDFLVPNDAVRNTLEQIDVTRQLALQYADRIALANTADNVWANFKQQRKVTHLIGLEGAHSLGNSLGVLRTFYDLGVRYLTLTHTCHNAFADSSGSSQGVQAEPLHGGLSALGRRLVREMNRIGSEWEKKGGEIVDVVDLQRRQTTSAPFLRFYSSDRGCLARVRRNCSSGH